MNEPLNFVRSGPRGATPVVLLHSAGLDLTWWDRQLGALTNYDVMALDLPGHGRSSAPAEQITIDRMALAVATCVRQETDRPVHLIGLSVGGVIAQWIALEHPDLVASLVLIDTSSRFAPTGQKAMRRRARVVRERGMAAVIDDLFSHWLLPETLAERPDLFDRGTKSLLADDPAGHAALWETIADFDVTGRLHDITAPTLVLVGEHDSTSPVSSAEALRDGIAGARLEVVPGAAHLSPIERPEVVNAIVTGFLETQSTSKALDTSPGPRVPLIDPATLSGTRREQYDRFPSNLTRTLLLLDERLGSALPEDANALRASSLDPRLREAVILRVAGHHRSAHERLQHLDQARQLGWVNDQIESIWTGGEAGLPDDTVAVLRLVDAVVAAPVVQDDVFDAARVVLDDRDIVTLIALVGHYMSVARLVGVLRVPLDEHADSWAHEH